MTDLLASFTAPESIGTTANSMLWALPLSAAIAVVYKATKVKTVKAWSFAKESFVLFGSIVVFMASAALIMCAAAWFINEKLPGIMGH